MSSHCPKAMPRRATISPRMAALSSNNTVNMVGSLLCRTAASQPRLPLVWRNSRKAMAYAPASNAIATVNTT